jgi:hypothetical protein
VSFRNDDVHSKEREMRKVLQVSDTGTNFMLQGRRI